MIHQRMLMEHLHHLVVLMEHLLQMFLQKTLMVPQLETPTVLREVETMTATMTTMTMMRRMTLLTRLLMPMVPLHLESMVLHLLLIAMEPPLRSMELCLRILKTMNMMRFLRMPMRLLRLQLRDMRQQEGEKVGLELEMLGKPKTGPRASERDEQDRLETPEKSRKDLPNQDLVSLKGVQHRHQDLVSLRGVQLQYRHQEQEGNFRTNAKKTDREEDP